MRPSHAIALWLFDRLGLDAALYGDLLEERLRGRSAVWYWRQVLIAVCVGIWDAIRGNKLLALRAVATGFMIEYLHLLIWEFLVRDTKPLPPDDIPPFTLHLWIVNLSLILITQTATGWLVGRTHRRRQFPMVVAFLICFLLWFFSPRIFWAARLAVAWDRIDPRVHPYIVYTFVMTFLTVVGVLLGGVIGSSKKAAASESCS
jgi:hypothetical protein